ncbi:MAG: SpoIID/LytB domain-containing protein [Calditrichaeota bacterium]|nr:MAG: SpoIID/LytB domain-containing protein [Calditrichota bacterium]
MLSEHVIPQSEPDLSVGIILPEDNIQQVVVDIPMADYNVSANDAYVVDLKNETTLTFSLAINKVQLRIGDDVELNGESLFIRQVGECHMQQNAGILVHDVVAGRGFHWRKKIGVYLPGDLEIKFIDNTLVLINHVSFEHYLMCVATSEMGAACPPALIEAQTIAARSWMLANVEKKHRHLGMDVCNDDCCQRYQGTNFLTEQSITGAQNSHGIVAMYKGAICDARYSKSCGGMMESFDTIWGGGDLAYMQVKRDIVDDSEQKVDLRSNDAMRHWLETVPNSFCSPKTIPENELIRYLGGVDEEGHYYRWEVRFSQLEMTAELNRTLSLGADKIAAITTGQRGGSGRLKSIDIVYIDKMGEKQKKTVQGDVAIRAALHAKFLYSSAIHITSSPPQGALPEQFHIRGAGWGHGAGLCQIGALGMALENYSTEEIILHYYPGSNLVKLY